jgi:hypothetical protein
VKSWATFLEITSQLPDFIGFYNGKGAGASIPHHFHFQFFKRPEGQEPFALEDVAARAKVHPFVLTGDEYPITSIYFRGERQRVIAEATQWVHRWTEFYNNNMALSANIIATLDDELHDVFHLYFVPRNTAFSHAPGVVGIIGGLEVLGELVFTTDLEKQHLDSGRVNYDYVKRVLSAVEAPGVREFVKKAI